MADYKELIFSDDFKAYRKKQLEVVVKYVHNILKDGIYQEFHAAELQGALKMATKLLKLPSELIGDNNLIDELNRLIQEDLISLTTYLVRENLK